MRVAEMLFARRIYELRSSPFVSLELAEMDISSPLSALLIWQWIRHWQQDDWRNQKNKFEVSLASLDTIGLLLIKVQN